MLILPLSWGVIIQINKKTNKTEVKKKKKSGFKNILDVVKYAARIANDKNADYIKIIDVKSRLIITDYFMIISAKNIRLTKSISKEIQKKLKEYDVYPFDVEGISEGNWVLMDYRDFIVHIFTDEYKDFYDLERLWKDSKYIDNFLD